MNGSGCKNCPVKPCETMNYRGSTCAAQRAKFGLGDPQTNADRIRAMSYEELAQMLKRQGCPPSEHFSCYDKTCKECWFEWLQQPAGDAEQERPKATGSQEDGFGAHIARRFGSEV